MDTLVNVIPLVSGVWLLFVSQIMTTENITSALIFKFIPLTLGIACLFSGAKLMQWI